MPTKTPPKTELDLGHTKTGALTEQDSVDLIVRTDNIKTALAENNNDDRVDVQRVNELKQAIADGTYQIDTQKIAKKMTQFDSFFTPNST